MAWKIEDLPHPLTYFSKKLIACSKNLLEKSHPFLKKWKFISKLPIRRNFLSRPLEKKNGVNVAKKSTPVDQRTLHLINFLLTGT